MTSDSDISDISLGELFQMSSDESPKSPKIPKLDENSNDGQPGCSFWTGSNAKAPAKRETRSMTKKKANNILNGQFGPVPVSPLSRKSLNHVD